MAIPFPDNISVGVGNPLDSRYLSNLNTPYIDTSAVTTSIVESQRYVGLTVNVDNEEYWFKEGITDPDLIVKSSGGVSNLTGATNGLSLFSGNTQVGLGGCLSNNTIVCADGHTFQVGDAGPGAAFSMNQDTVSTSFISSSGACTGSLTILPEYVRIFTLSPVGYIDKINIVTGSTAYASTTVCALGGDSLLTCTTPTTLSICSSDSGFVGVQYGDDYENNFCPRSLVTAQYVTGITSGITGAFTTANNGLCANNQIVSLGGILTGNTVISGATKCLSFGDANSFLDTTTFLTKTLSVSGDGLFNKLIMSGEFGSEAGSFCTLVSNSDVTSTGNIRLTTDDVELPQIYLGLGAAGGLKNEIKMCGDYYRQEVGGYTGDSTTFIHCICTEDFSNSTTYWELYDTDNSAIDVSYSGSFVDKRHAFGINNEHVLYICSGGTARYGVATGATDITHYADLTNKAYVDNLITSGITASSNTVAVCNVYANYTATTTNDFIGVSGATEIYLPPSPKACQRITVADICGDALNNTICVIGNGFSINGSSSATINTDYGSMTFINNGVFWSAVAFIN